MWNFYFAFIFLVYYFNFIQKESARALIGWEECYRLSGLRVKQTIIRNRVEKSLRRVAMVAKSLDDKKLKKALIKWIRTVSNSHRFYSISFNLSNVGKIFIGLNQKGPYLSLEKEKQHFCVVLTYFGCLILGRIKNKSAMNVKSCCFADIKPLPFSSSLCRWRRRCLSSLLLWSRNFVSMEKWLHIFPLC